MGNTSTYNKEYYLKNKERISEKQKMRIKNMTAVERKVYLNRMKDYYRNRNGRFVSKSELQEENKKLKDEVRFLEECLDRKEKLNEKYRKEIKDHQLYEEKLEHRIIEFEELLHGE